MVYVKKGFTLIELLVVIAIIGILSSVVLVSLNSARDKAADSAVKQGMGQLQAAAELYYDSNSNSYGVADACTEGHFASSTAIITNIGTNAAAALECSSDGSDWAASADLKGGSFWCVDSTGAKKAVSTGITAGTDFECPTS